MKMLKIEISNEQYELLTRKIQEHDIAQTQLSLIAGVLLAAKHKGQGVLKGTATDNETKQHYVVFQVEDKNASAQTEGKPESTNATPATNSGDESNRGSHETSRLRP
jgi:hypothetical protein